MTAKQEVSADDKGTFLAVKAVHKHIQLPPGD